MEHVLPDDPPDALVAESTAAGFGSCADCTDQHTYEDACRFRLDDDGSVLHLMSVTTAVLTDD